MIKKKVSSIDHNIIIIYFSSQKILSFVTCSCASSSNGKTKSLFTPWKLGPVKKSKYWVSLSVINFLWYLFQLIVLLKAEFNLVQAVLLCLELIILSYIIVSYNWDIKCCISYWKCCIMIRYIGRHYNAVFRPIYINSNFTIN